MFQLHKHGQDVYADIGRPHLSHESFLSHGGLIGGRAVEGGNSDIVEAKINGQLTPVVNDVIENHGAHHGHFWHFQNSLSFYDHAPHLHHVFIGHASLIFG